MCCTVWRNWHVIWCWVQHLLNYQFSQQYSYISLWQVGRLWGCKELKGQTTIPPPPPPPWLGHSLAKWPASPHLWQVLSPGTRAKWQKNEWYTSPLLSFLCSLQFIKKGSLHIHCSAVLILCFLELWGKIAVPHIVRTCVQTYKQSDKSWKAT